MDEIKKYLIRATSGAFIIKIGSIVFSLISGIVLARTLGTSGYGIYAFTISLTSLLSIPATMGMEQVLVRKISIYQTQLNWNFIKGIMLKANQIGLITTIGIIICASLFIALLKPSNPIFEIKTIHTGLLIIFLMPMARISMSSLRGFKKTNLSQIPEFVIKQILFIILLSILITSLFGENIVALRMDDYGLNDYEFNKKLFELHEKYNVPLSVGVIPFAISFGWAIFIAIQSFSMIYMHFINGVGKVKLQMIVLIAMAFLNIPLSIFLAKNVGMGVSGVIFATNIAVFINSILMSVQYRKIIFKNAVGIWNK